SCCCRVQSLSGAPCTAPHSLSPSPPPSRAHFQVPHTGVCSFFCHGVSGSFPGPFPLCCQAPNFQGPPYHLLMLLPGPHSLSWVPLRPPPLLLSPSPHSAPTVPCSFRSPHTAGVFSIF
ncbi:unnamed protein product, partial [Staurois parvus]